MAEYKSIWTGKQVDNAVGEVANKLSKPTNDASGEVGWGLVKTADGSEWAKIEVAADLNSLEAKLNENIIKDPSKTYLAVKGSQIPPDSAQEKMLVMPANSSVDWGDGTVETYDGKTTLGHKYSDDVEYHLVAISGLTGIPSNMLQDWGCVIDVSLANNIATLGAAAFYISGIKALVVPASVTQIDTMAVGGLSSVIMEGSTPPTLSTDAPLFIDKIIVPKSAINTYKSATGWSQYADKIVYEVDSSDVPDMEKYVNLTSSQTITGTKTLNNLVVNNDMKFINVFTDGETSISLGPKGKIFKNCTISLPIKTGTLALVSDIKNTNLENGTGTSSVQQKQDGTSGTFDFTNKNPNATKLDSTLTGQIPYGATGNFSASFGGKGAAQGKRSFQAGTTTIAKGNYSAAFGDNSVALGNDSFTANYENVSSGLASASFGQQTLAGGEASFTEGTGSAVRSVIPTTSSGGSSSGGSGTGSGTVTQPDDWEDNNHLGNSTHVEGRGCVGYGVAAHVGGAFNTGYGHRSYVGGSSSRVGTTKQDAGNILVVEGGTNSFAHGKTLVVEGNQSGSFGDGNNVLADSAFSAGVNNYIGQNATGSATVGSNNHISGSNSFTAGLSNTVSAEDGFTVGYSNTVSGRYSGAVGVGLTADALTQFVVGKYNKPNAASLFIVGGGSSSVGGSTNLFEVLNDGRAKVQTAPIDVDDVVRKQDVCMNLSDGAGENSLIQKAPDGKENTAAMEGGIALGKNSHANQKYDFAIGGANAIAGFTKEQFNSYYWDGTQALHGGKGKDSDGNILDFTGSKYEDSFGYNFAVGDTAIANGRTAVAFQQGKAYGKEAVAFGTSTADGEQAFAINNSYASGYDSFSQGSNTVAKYAQQAVFGRWNDNKEDDIFEIGVGSGEPDPIYGLPETKNAFEITKTGKVKVLNEPSENDDVVRKQELDTKYDKTGGTIGGNVIITGDLTVNGTQHINNTENLNVENAMIYSNAKGATLATNGGIGIKKNATDVYGIVYDPTSDSVKLGLGKSDDNGKFTFNTDEGQPVAIRDDSSKLTNGHLVQWDGTNHKLVDGGAKPDLSNYVDLSSTQTITGAKTFTSGIKVTSDIETEYTDYYNAGIYNHSATNSWYYTFPKKEGTFALTSDIPDTSNFANVNDANNFKQTITVGDSLTATSRVDIDKEFVKVISAKGMTVYNQGSISNMGGVLTLPEKSGTLALTSDVAAKSSFSVEVW